MYSYGPPHMAKQKLDDQVEHTFSSYVRIRNVVLKTWQRRWIIGRSGERGSGISVLATRHDDDDDDIVSSIPVSKLFDDMPLRSISQSMYLFTKPSVRGGCDKKSIFYAAFKRFLFRVFVPLDRFPYQDWRVTSAQQFYPKLGVLTLCYVNSLLEDSNSGHHVHFLREEPLHHRRLLNQSMYKIS